MDTMTLNKAIVEIEDELINKHHELVNLKKQLPREEVNDYELKGQYGLIKLSSLFGDKKDLIIIHNMGVSCPLLHLVG